MEVISQLCTRRGRNRVKAAQKGGTAQGAARRERQQVAAQREGQQEGVLGRSAKAVDARHKRWGGGGGEGSHLAAQASFWMRTPQRVSPGLAHDVGELEAPRLW